MVRDTTEGAGSGAPSFPLSPMQQGMLFHHLEGGARGIDVEQVIGELRHPVSAPDFEQAWRIMVRRHECFRTMFRWEDGAEPRQVVLPPDEVVLPVRLLSFSCPADAETLLAHYLEDDRRAGFGSLSAPLARVALFQGGAAHAWFVFTYHHLILDARGTVNLFKELMAVHDALTSGAAIDLPPAPRHRDYVAWLQTLDGHRAEAF